MKTLVKHVEPLWGFIQRLGPYLILEMVLPGGTTVALLLFLYRSYRRRADHLAIGAERMRRGGSWPPPAVARVFRRLAKSWPAPMSFSRHAGFTHEGGRWTAQAQNQAS